MKGNNRLEDKSLFSFGISDKVGVQAEKKQDGARRIVDFKYLAEKEPQPFQCEWARRRAQDG